MCAYTLYTRGLSTLTMSQHNIFHTVKLSQIFLLVLLMGFEPRVFGSRVRHSTNWATPSPHSPLDEIKTEVPHGKGEHTLNPPDKCLSTNMASALGLPLGKLLEFPKGNMPSRDDYTITIGSSYIYLELNLAWDKNDSLSIPKAHFLAVFWVLLRNLG